MEFSLAIRQMELTFTHKIKLCGILPSKSQGIGCALPAATLTIIGQYAVWQLRGIKHPSCIKMHRVKELIPLHK